MLRHDRQEMYEQVAAALTARYNEVRAARLEGGLAGTSAETILIDWIKQWLPGRISIRNGAVISVTDGPTNQMDCLLFDHIECPVFQRIGQTDILPVEGVSGAIEMNYGENTSYNKLITDAQKLTMLGHLAVSRLRRPGVAMSHLPLDVDPSSATTEQVLNGLTFHQGHDLRPLLLIFAEQLSGSLHEAATRIMSHNKKTGVRFSVDGLFVLKQGIALHMDENKKGWTLQRLRGGEFGCLNASEGHVLLKLQNVVLTHLYLSGKTHPKGFDAYTAMTSQGEQEIGSATIISDQEYSDQPDQSISIRG